MTTDTETNFAEFLHGYLTCALWSSTDSSNEGAPLDDNFGIEDIAPAALAKLTEGARDFFNAQAADLATYAQKREHVRHRGEGTAWDYAGHDFWLTHNRHGAGFQDRGLGALGDRLADAARLYSEVDLYVGDDGQVYV